MTLKFTAITQDDVSQLMPIENACHSHPWSEKTFRSCIGGRYFSYYVTLDDKICGFYVAEIVLDEATLMDICISPDFQGQGLGKKALNDFVSKAQALGANTLFLEVRAKNISALMMYINAGFVEIARRTGYYPSEIGYEDAIVMQKKLA
ncbi:ribosomal protein S18-alanine N-acetyltransferase [Thalassotalea marina]|uniref:[Ribosomal protein bS18]-alanine N-acetyltransferase n=1 Tax=Thalassotalea marina TaxID=1673741 RepID=A0A919BQJ5_9GAMM|nr:ribosomal protein S18-alanine N-acetyltransferase [Thalassotalea marina]GHG03467.1 ribosomal-protein-alanine acetyltransferase [Thalassotalea marina]